MVFEQGPHGQARFACAEMGSSGEPSKGTWVEVLVHLGQVQVVSAEVIPKEADR